MDFRPLRDFLKKIPAIKRYARWYYTKTGNFDWEKIMQENSQLWESVFTTKSSKRKILIGTSVGYNLSASVVESMLSVALALRGADVHILLCDGILPACLACEVSLFGQTFASKNTELSNMLCQTCKAAAETAFQDLKLPVHSYSRYLYDKDSDTIDQIVSNIHPREIKKYKYNGIAVGEHAYAGALRYYARGDLNGEPNSESVLKQYLNASLISLFITSNLLQEIPFECAVFNHGIYVPHGIIGEVCRKRDVRVVNWNPAYKTKCFIFSHDNTYHHTMVTDSVDKWQDMEWSEEKDRILSRYLKDRWFGKNDWIWFHHKPIVDMVQIKKELSIDLNKPTIGLLTNVIWDAALHYPSNAYDNMIEWVFETIKYFKSRKDIQLIIRIHPAEIQGSLPSRQLLFDEIEKEFKELPENIYIIKPDSRISTYRIMSECDSVLIYNTKTGIELSAMGLPVIVTGEAWIRNKGFSIDAENPENYKKILDGLPLGKRLDGKKILRAKKYAYYFYFERMIPLEKMEKRIGNPPYRLKLENLEELMPGQCAGLDLICDGIIHQREFIYRGNQGKTF